MSLYLGIPFPVEISISILMAFTGKFLVQISAFFALFAEQKDELLLLILLNMTFLFLLLWGSHGVVCTCHRRWSPHFPSGRTYRHL